METTSAIFVPFAGGSGDAFRPFRRYITPMVRFIPITYPDAVEKSASPSVERFSGMVRYVRNVIEEVPGRVVLFGHSMGAIVAYEAALKSHNIDRIDRLFVSACPPPRIPLRQDLADFRDEDELLKRVVLLGGLPVDIAHGHLGQAVLRRLKRDLSAYASYRSSPDKAPLPFDICALCGADDDLAPASVMVGWAGYTTAGFKIITFPGGHFFFAGRANEVTSTLLRMSHDSTHSADSYQKNIALSRRLMNCKCR